MRFCSVLVLLVQSSLSNSFILLQNSRLPALRLLAENDDNTKTTAEEGTLPPPPIEESVELIVQQKAPQPQAPAPAVRRQPTATEMMTAMGTTPRRIAIGTLTATGIALAGNFLGVTSQLLTAFPEEAVEATSLDTYFPRGDYKRVRENGYTFVIPKEWVADTFVALAKAQRQARSLDLKMRRSSSYTTLPDSAFGPPGRLNKNGVSEQGDTNVSVIVSGGLPGFSLRGTLGSPTAAASTLLRVSLAPEGSGRVATLLDAEEDAARNVYQFTYDVDRGEKGKPLRAVSVIAARADTLITSTVVAPRDDWDDLKYAEKLRKVASSFHLTG